MLDVAAMALELASCLDEHRHVERFPLSMIRQLLTRAIPGQVVMQYTDRCNALCPQCGMRRTEMFPRSTLGVDTAKRVIDAAAQRGVRALSFTGGEPLLYLDEIILLIEHATAAGIPYVRTGTNGFLFMRSDRPDFQQRVETVAERLARTRLYTFWISIDSAVPEMHETMRGLPGVIRGIEKALPVFHRNGIYPSANLGINRNTGGLFDGRYANARAWYWHFRWSFPAFYRFVEALGFTIVNACYPMSAESNEGPVSAVYQATSSDDVVRFSRTDRQAVFRALFDSIPEFRSRLRIFTPRSSLRALIRQYEGDIRYAYPCRGGREFFFVDAKSGDTFPCGYRGNENLGKLWDLSLPGRNGEECRLCDWECFRDPSEFLGPLGDLTSRPWRLLSKLFNDRESISLWLEDLRYYRACDFFNGRKQPDRRKLARFGPPMKLRSSNCNRIVLQGEEGTLRAKASVNINQGS
jgi:MoaA/NifB/PqqE/SkfB family radical SAM enzyme